MTIYQAIPSIMAEIGAIGKDRTNQGQGYKYRGIEDFYNVCQPLMVKYKVFSVPNVTAQHREERQSKSGGVLIYTILTIEYTFFAEDGSCVKATVVGEGMDSGDKSSNKAMSVAHKYALAQMFAVPTVDMVDPETDSPEPVARVAPIDHLMSDRRDIETEIGKLASMLGADAVTSARETIKSIHDMTVSKGITFDESLAKVKKLRDEIAGEITKTGKELF